MAEPKVDCVLDIQAGLGECPVWDPATQSLYWIDIYTGRLNQFDPSSGSNKVWTLAEPIGSFALAADGTVLLALKSGLHRYDLETAKLTKLAAPEPGKPKNRLNDGRADAAGRFWVGSMTDPPEAERPDGALYRFDRDHRLSAMVDKLFVANGLAFSPDNKILYQSDSFSSVRTIWAWDFDLAAGRIANRRVFVDTHGMPGRPDGGAVDADGCYWSAATDGWEIVRFTPKGKVDRRIPLPVAKPTMVAFGGPRLDTIYITSIRPKGDLSGQPQAGSLFAVSAGCVGLPEPRFGG
jgi:L-arabinonolactonase